MNSTLIRKLYLIISFSMLLSASVISAAEVNIYSARKEDLIKPILEKFEQVSGIEVNLVTGKADALLQRLISEGKHSPADILITTDAGRLYRAKTAKVLQKIKSEVLSTSIPEQYRDPEGYWFGLTLRARPIVYAVDRINPDQLSSYESLANPEWKNKVCIRSSDNIYNQSLVASILAHLEEEKTLAWAKSFVQNFARPPQGGDRDQVKAVAAGQCDLAIVNNYYLGKMLTSKDESEVSAAQKVKIFWPNQENRGTHVNISGAAITASAKNKDAALRLLEFLVSDTAQQWYAEKNLEYPIKPGIKASEILQSWGEFKADSLSLNQLGERNAEAVMIMDRAKWK
ncbi:MAG: Fe(3+) ABC transporter substrate-binding protein [Gammaproteobacteria bacterium]